MFELRVLNGLHEGATLPLSGDAWELGNAEERDLQLCDNSIASLHAHLSREDERWQLTPKEGEVYLAHGEAVRDGLQLDLNQPFQLSGVWLVVSDASEPWASSSIVPINAAGVITQPKPKRISFNRWPVWFKPALVIFGILSAIIVTGWLFTSSSKSVQQTDLKPVLADSDGLKAILARKLEERDLSKVVIVTGNNHGMALTGAVTPDQSGIVSRLMVSLRNDYDIRVPLNNATTIKKLTLPFRIVQITAGKHANVVIDGGQRMFIGDEHGGYTLSKITKDSVQFTGPESISVSW